MEYKVTRDSSYLAHYGVLGMHWGQRKQNDRQILDARRMSEANVQKLHQDFKDKELKYHQLPYNAHKDKRDKAMSDYKSSRAEMIKVEKLRNSQTSIERGKRTVYQCIAAGTVLGMGAYAVGKNYLHAI